MLDKQLEAELRAAINPAYEDVKGTESYERKRLLGEINRLREILSCAADILDLSHKSCIAKGYPVESIFYQDSATSIKEFLSK